MKAYLVERPARDWCKEQTGATTYYPCFKQYVEIDWSKYEDYSR